MYNVIAACVFGAMCALAYSVEGWIGYAKACGGLIAGFACIWAMDRAIGYWRRKRGNH